MIGDPDEMGQRWRRLHPQRGDSLLQEAYGPHGIAEFRARSRNAVRARKVGEAMQANVVKFLPLVVSVETRRGEDDRMGCQRQRDEPERCDEPAALDHRAERAEQGCRRLVHVRCRQRWPVAQSQNYLGSAAAPA